MARERKDSAQTKMRLMDAAEKLFTTRGIDNVTMADVGRAAQQKNRNALQYHFQNKAGLINAVLDRHTESITARRQEMLQQLAPEPSLRSVVHILVTPVIEKLADREKGEAFIAINAQLMVSQGLASIRLARTQRIPEAKKIQELLLNFFGDVSHDEIVVKQSLIDAMLFCGLASYLTRNNDTDLNRFANILIDSICHTINN